MHIQDSIRQVNDPTSEGPLILPFSAIDASKLALVGGKAANLGELTRGGFPVTEGFCVTTNAYALITDGIGLEPILDELAVTRSDDTTRLQGYATVVRASLLAAIIPNNLLPALPDNRIPISISSVLMRSLMQCGAAGPHSGRTVP